MTEHTPNIHQTSTKNINQNDQRGTIIIPKQKVTRNLKTTSNTKIHKPNNQKHTITTNKLIENLETNQNKSGKRSTDQKIHNKLIQKLLENLETKNTKSTH